jgi:hypothetical protein
VAQPTETPGSHSDLDAIAAALAERLHLNGDSPWMNTAEAASTCASRCAGCVST